MPGPEILEGNTSYRMPREVKVSTDEPKPEDIPEKTVHKVGKIASLDIEERLPL